MGPFYKHQVLTVTSKLDNANRNVGKHSNWKMGIVPGMESPIAPVTLAPPASVVSCLQTKPPICAVSCVCKHLHQWTRLKASVCWSTLSVFRYRYMHTLSRGDHGDIGLTFQTEFPCSLGVNTWLLMFRGSFVLLNMSILENKQSYVSGDPSLGNVTGIQMAMSLSQQALGLCS